VQVFIDGFRQMPGGGGRAASGTSLRGSGAASAARAQDPGEDPVVEMLSRVNPSDIEMIEVYRGLSEIPGVFHWDGCAVIAVWTRWNR